MLAFPSKQSSRGYGIRDIRAALMAGEAAFSLAHCTLPRKHRTAFERACNSRCCAACRSEFPPLFHGSCSSLTPTGGLEGKYVEHLSSSEII